MCSVLHRRYGRRWPIHRRGAPPAAASDPDLVRDLRATERALAHRDALADEWVMSRLGALAPAPVLVLPSIPAVTTQTSPSFPEDDSWHHDWDSGTPHLRSGVANITHHPRNRLVGMLVVCDSVRDCLSRCLREARWDKRRLDSNLSMNIGRSSRWTKDWGKETKRNKQQENKKINLLVLTIQTVMSHQK